MSADVDISISHVEKDVGMTLHVESMSVKRFVMLRIALLVRKVDHINVDVVG